MPLDNLAHMSIEFGLCFLRLLRQINCHHTHEISRSVRVQLEDPGLFDLRPDSFDLGRSIDFATQFTRRECYLFIIDEAISLLSEISAQGGCGLGSPSSTPSVPGR